MTKTTDTPVIAFKGFDANFQCRSYQYEVGGKYTHDGAVEMCKTGFHACENPLDVWRYYGPCDGNRFAVVELSGSIERKDGEDSKLCAATLHVKAELKLPEFVKSAVTWLIDHCKSEKAGESVQDASGGYAKLAASGGYAKLAASGGYAKLAASGDSAKLAASGHSAQLAASGHSAQLAASGDSAKLAASGDYAKLAASGGYAQLAASGDSAQLAASGDSAKLAASGHSAQLAASGDSAKLAASGGYAQLAASGHSAQLAASGDSAKLAASGGYAKLAASGKDSVISSSSRFSKAQGAEGTWIALAEFDDNGKCVGFATGCAGKDGVPTDTWLMAQGGKLVEVES